MAGGKGKNPGQGKRRQARHRDAEPLQNKRRQPKGKVERDVFEAEDSDPDEVKNSRRYDEVENYEYEMPSDFEDEEIDEDLAFTEEDKKKYAGWFEKEVDAGDDEDEDGGDREGSDGIDLLESSEGGEQDGEADEDGQDDEDDGFLDQLGSDDDEDGDGDGDEEEEEDDERHRAMLADVVGGGAAAKRQKRAGGEAVLSEAYPESEYNLNPGSATAAASGELTVADLVAGLSDGRRQLGPARKLLERVAGGAKAKGPVAVPLPKAIKERSERKAGYEKTSEEVTKWQPLVKANREAPTLHFTSASHEAPRLATTAALAKQHQPETELEQEVAALLEAAGADSARAVEEAEAKLSLKALSVEEAKERAARLAKLRSLLFHQQQKAKHLKAIKSKEYHRKLAKSAKRKALKAGEAGGDDEEAARKAAEEAEFERAKERLTLKHRNTSRWARRALQRGQDMMDPGTKAAIAEQLALGQSLRRKMEGGPGGRGEGGDDSASTSASDDDGGSGGEEGAFSGPGQAKGLSSKAKAAALEILAGNGPSEVPLPEKGLFALPFMRRALERQRQAAKEEAAQVLQEIEEQEHEEAAASGREAAPSTSAPATEAFAAMAGGFGAGGRMRFGQGSAATNAADSGSESDDDNGLGSDADEDLEAKAERLGQRLAGGGDQQARKPRGGAAAGRLKAGGMGTTRLASAADVATIAAADVPDPEHLLASSSGADVAAELAASRQAAGQAATTSGRPGSCELTNGLAGAGTMSANRADLFAPKQAKGKAAAGAAGEAGPEAGAAFIAAKKFGGPRPGYVFQRGPQGVGYYRDAKAAAGTGRQQQPQKGGKAAAAHQQQGAKAQQQQAAQQQGQQQQQNEEAGGGSGSDGDDADHHDQEGGMRPAPGSKQALQQQLIRQAFAGDDVEAEFQADKAAEVSGELPSAEVAGAMPGWGTWSDQQREPRWMREAKAKAERERAAAAARRKDAGLKHVVLSEKWDKKAAKYLTPELPYPYTSKEVYERSLRQPLGRQYNPDASFRDLTRPAVLKATGVTIAPMRYSQALAKGVSAGTAVAAGPNGVARVAGGMLRQGAKRKAGVK